MFNSSAVNDRQELTGIHHTDAWRVIWYKGTGTRVYETPPISVIFGDSDQFRQFIKEIITYHICPFHMFSSATQ